MTVYTTTLGQFILDVAELCGYADGEVVCTNLTDELEGAIIAEDFDFRSLLAELAWAFGFDVTFSDKVYCTRPPVGIDFAVDVALTTADIIDENYKAIVSNRTAENELPTDVEIRYLDATLNYTQANQIAHRPQFPLRTSQTNNRKTYTVPVVLTGAEAAGLAARALYRAWNTRLQHSMKLLPKKLALEPGDIISFPLDGDTYIAKVNEASIGADLSIAVKATKTWVYDDLTSDADDYASITPYATKTKDSSVVVVDTVFVNDPADDTNGASLRVYFVGYPTYPGLTWPGCELYYSTDNVTFTSVGTISDEPIIGTTTNTLGTVSDITVQDDTNTVVVNFRSADVSALLVDDSTYLANGDVIAVGASGRWELIKVTQVEFNDGGSVTLSGLWRGRNGSGAFKGTHATGDTVVLMKSGAYVTTTLPLSLLGQTLYVKAVGTGQTEADIAATSLTLYGAARYTEDGGVGHVTVTGYAPTVSQALGVTPSTGNLTVTGYAPTVGVNADVNLSPGTGHVTVTGYAPTVATLTDTILGPATGHVTVTGYVPTVTVSSGANFFLGEGGSNQLLAEGGTNQPISEGS